MSNPCDSRVFKRFEREARIAANLHHTNIVEVFGVGEQDGFHYYVMQYIRGRRVGRHHSSAREPRVQPRQRIRRQRAAEAPTNGSSENAIAEAAVRQLLGEEDARVRTAWARLTGRTWPGLVCRPPTR